MLEIWWFEIQSDFDAKKKHSALETQFQHKVAQIDFRTFLRSLN